MKFECDKEQFLLKASMAARFTGRHTNLPILSSLLLVAEGGVLLLRATNLECGVEVSIPASVSTDGVVAVSAPVLIGFLGNGKGKVVEASLDGEVLRVRLGKATAAIKTISHDDFPILPQVPAENSFSVSASDFSSAIKAVAYCASTSVVKPELQGIYVSGEVGAYTVVATDSFRLAEKKSTLKSKGGISSMLLPARNAVELTRLLDGVSDVVDIYYTENQLSLRTGGVYYTSRLLGGAFPNYQQIIPKESETEAVVLKEDLAAALKSLSVFSDKFSQIAVAIEPKEKRIRLSSKNQEVGEEECELSAVVSGNNCTMTFNGRYLADGLQSIAGDSVRLGAHGAGKPLVMRDASNQSFLYLVMPMNR